MNKKERAFEEAHQAFRAAELMRDKAEAELNTAAAEYYQDRFGVKVGVSVIECPSEKIPPSLIVNLVHRTGSIYSWLLAPIRKRDGKPAELGRWLSAEAPIKVLGEYNGQKWKQPRTKT